MLDLKKIRDNPETLQTLLAKRGILNPWKDDPGGLDLERFLDRLNRHKKLLQEVEDLRTKRNKLSEEFGRLKRTGGSDAAIQKEIDSLKQILPDKEKDFAQFEQGLNDALLRLPNFPDVSVPEGKSGEENVQIRTEGRIPEFAFEAKPHWQIGEALGILDFNAAGKISGSRFTVLRGKGAALERALVSFMLELHIGEHGYTEIFAPYLVTAQTMQGTGQLPKFEEELFRLERDQLYLIPTAEVSVTNLHRDDFFDEKDLPKRYVSYSACFRREAGSYGKDTKGLIRNHQFNKVELVWFAKPETAFNDLEILTGHAEEVLKRLKIPYRTLLLCSGDMGFSSAKTYDLEVWMPGEKRWREISSCSCFTDFQARRMNIKYKTSAGKKDFVHTLNGSGVAVGRLFAAILENYQQKDGTVLLPEALQPYLKFKEIKP